MGNMGRTWARLLSYFNKDKPIGALSMRQRLQLRAAANARPKNDDSDDDSDNDLREARNNLR